MTEPERPTDGFRIQLEQMTGQLVALERRAKVLAELNRLLSQGREPLALAQRAVDLVMRATGASGTYVYLWDPEVERLVMRVATTGRVAQYLGKIQLRLGEGINGWSALMRQAVVIDDHIEDDPRFVKLPGIEEDFRSMVAAPIAVPGGDILGVFSLYAENPEAFDKNAVELATEVGGLLASGLVHAETVNDLRRESAAARFLLNVPSEAAESVQRCVDELANSIRNQVDADLCVIELADRGSVGQRIRPGLAFAQRVDRALVQAGRSVRSRADLPELVEGLGGRLDKISSSFGSLSPEGAITCFRNRPFSKSDSGVVEALGAQASVLIGAVRGDSESTPLAGRLASARPERGPSEVLHELGWRESPAHPVLVRIQSGRHASSRAFDNLVHAMRDISASSRSGLVVPSAPLVSVLVPYEPTLWRNFEQALRTTLKQHRLEAPGSVAVGIGPLAPDSRALADALVGAETALSWAELLGDSVPIVHYPDIAHLKQLPRVALAVGEELREAIARFTEVVRYDHRHGTNLAGTLDRYLATRCSAVETAKIMFIHRNTLRQRLARIEEVVGRPVDDIEDWAVASLAARMAFADGGVSRLRQQGTQNDSTGS